MANRRSLTAILAGTLLAALAATPAAEARLSPKKAIWGPAYINGVSQFPRYHDLGVGTYEAGVNWHDVVPTRPRRPRDPNDPAYQWPGDVTRAVTEAQGYGIRVALQITGAPGWANGGRGASWAPKKDADFADFAYALARRYPSVHLWMIWGEPSRAANFKPLKRVRPDRPLTRVQAAAPRRYARLLDAAYGALKQAGRQNRVVGGMTFTTGDISAWQWISAMRLPNGRPPRLDLYGHNPFTGRKPQLNGPKQCCGLADFSDLTRLHRAVDRNLRRRGHGTIPLFLSEFTLPTDVDSEFNYHVDPQTQADWIGLALRAVERTRWIAALGWIHLYDGAPAAGGGLVSHGGLLYSDGSPKPGYGAFKSG